MGNIIIGVIIAFIISFYAIPIIIQLADQVKLYDIPDERKVHKKPIPSLGGLGIFIGFLIFLSNTTIDTTSIISSMFIFLACISLPHFILMHLFYKPKK